MKPADRPIRWRRALLWGSGLPLGWLVLRALACDPDLVERLYSAGLFPIVRDALRATTGVLGISAAEVVIGVATLWAGRVLISSALVWRRGERSLTNLCGHGAARCVALVGVLYVLFLVSWGFNHARKPYASHAGLERRELARAELGEPLTWLVGECNRLRGELDVEDWELRPDPGGLDQRLVGGYESLAREVPTLAQGRPLVRRAFLSPILGRLGISGIYSPFTAEAHVNGELVPWVRFFVSAHEVAHQKGFAREDEANFIAYQVCRRCDDPALVYSGTLVAMINVARALGPDAGEALELLDEVVREDLRQEREFWDSRRGPLMRVARGTNDLYLKAQGQPEGLRSYGRMVDLVVAEWRSRPPESEEGDR